MPNNAAISDSYDVYRSPELNYFASGDLTGVTDRIALQKLINSLRGVGGIVRFRGNCWLDVGLTLYPTIALMGGGPLSAFQNVGTDTLNVASGFAGPIITLIVDPLFPSISVFPYLANFTINGNAGAQTTQDGIQISGVNGAINDVYIQDVGIFKVGGNGINILASVSGKIWIDNVYVEACQQNGILAQSSTVTLTHVRSILNVLDGIKVTGGTAFAVSCFISGNLSHGIESAALVFVSTSFIQANTGAGIRAGASGNIIANGNYFLNNGTFGIDGTSCTTLIAKGNYFAGNGASAALDSGGSISIWSFTLLAVIVGNAVQNDGSTTNACILWKDTALAAQATIVGNAFTDTRGASAAKNFVYVPSGVVQGVIASNYFSGQSGASALSIIVAAHSLTIHGNRGYSVVGSVFMGDNRSGVTVVDGSPITLLTTPAGANQIYRVSIEIDATAFTSGTATYTCTWTENGVAQTAVVTATAINIVTGIVRLAQPDAATAFTVQVTGVFVATLHLTCVIEPLP